MTMLTRPTQQPFRVRLALIFFVTATAVLAVATGYYHQRWQNQVKRSTRLQKQLDIFTATQAAVLKVDPALTTK